MVNRHRAACFFSTSLVAFASSAMAQSVDQPQPSQGVDINSQAEIVVTAQKRSETINRVGMSITAASGDTLASRGVADVSQLVKVVPGFNFNLTSYGTPVYTIRGVGFQENSLGASPTVSVYVDEVPFAFSPETLGASLDIQRVEVLKGPQGTLYGGNSTGGAINFVAAKPTDTFAIGADATYGRFNDADISGFVSGPITDTLKVRLAGKTHQADAWQYSYTRNDRLGTVNQIVGRFLVDWEPSERLHVSLNVNGWRDRSDSPASQIVQFAPTNTAGPFPPALVNYPSPPRDSRAADWDPGVSFRQDTYFYQFSGRVDYDISPAIKLTSISSYEKYKRYMPIDTDGTALNNFRITLGGHTSTFFQELRLAGDAEWGHWVVGANYHKDNISDVNTFYLPLSTTSFLGNPQNVSDQRAETKSVFVSGDYKITPALTVLAGVRYTAADRTYSGCTRDYDGTVAGSGFFPGAAPGSCITLLNTFQLGSVHNELNQTNTSWRFGLNYEVARDMLLYANVSKGWKSGSFPLLSLAFEPQATPVTQESLLAYEVGAKLRVSPSLQLNTAAFYYDYRNKQIRGWNTFPIFGNLELLVNIPKSRVVGFEANATWRPVRGLTVAPSITLVDSRILGSFINVDPVGLRQEFAGDSFPYTPRWSGNTDAEYRWSLGSDHQAFIGGNVTYQSFSAGALGHNAAFDVPGYALVDLRAGIQGKNWTASLWGRNVFNSFYTVTVGHISDYVNRYTGRPATYGIRLSYRY